MTKNLEPQLKALIVNYLKDKGFIDKTDILINEFNIADFSRRVDLALVKEKRLFAYEIKSDGDTLLRLKDQVDKYLEYFDKVTVITTTKHTQKALLLIPNNVALWEVDSKKNKVKIIQKGKLILTKDKLSMINLMTVKDLVRVAKYNKITISNTRSDFEKKLMFLPSIKLKQYAIEAIKNRFEKVNLLQEENITINLFRKQISKKSENEKSIATHLDSLIASLQELETSLSND